MRDNMYVPEIRINWFVGWRGIDSDFRLHGYGATFKYLEDAIHHIEEYKFREKNNERIVWENEDES